MVGVDPPSCNQIAKLSEIEITTAVKFDFFYMALIEVE